MKAFDGNLDGAGVVATEAYPLSPSPCFNNGIPAKRQAVVVVA